jgi:hypothetical protein
MELDGWCKMWFAMEEASVIVGSICIGEAGVRSPDEESLMAATFESPKGPRPGIRAQVQLWR